MAGAGLRQRLFRRSGWLSNGRIVENVVSATNLEFEMLFAPVIGPMILKNLKK